MTDVPVASPPAPPDRLAPETPASPPTRVAGRLKRLAGLSLGVVLGVRAVTANGVSPHLLLVPFLVAAAVLPNLGSSGNLAHPRPGFGYVAFAAWVAATWWIAGDAPVVNTVAPLLLVLTGVALASRRRVGGEVPLTAVMVVVGGLTFSSSDPSRNQIVLWAAAGVTFVVASHHAQLRAAAPPGRHVSWLPRVRRGLLALLLVALGTPFVAALLSPVGTPPSPTYGEPGRHEAGPRQYWGFGAILDTAQRGELDDTEVLRVSAPLPSYWRATSFETWDGRYWTRSVTGQPRTVPPEADDQFVGFATVPESDAGAERAVRTSQLEQTYLVRSGHLTLLLAAPHPWTVRTPQLEVTVDPDGTLHSSHPLGEGSGWRVQSQQADVGVDALRSLRVVDDPGTDPVFTRLPRDLPARVVALAEQITSSQPTTYDRVAGIETWLSDNIELDPSPPVPEPGRDAVDRTLFTDRAGGGDQLASALVVLCRAAGIPARVAVGFTPHSHDVLRDEYVSRASDAHAWAEVWFGPAGWIPFDATTDIPLPADARLGLLDRLRAVLDQLGGVLLALVVATVLALVGWRIWRWVQAARPVPDEHRQLRRVIARFVTLVRSRSRPRRDHETLIAYAADVAPPELSSDVVRVATVLTDVAFGRTHDPREIEHLSGDVASLARRWPRDPPLARARRRLRPRA